MNCTRVPRHRYAQPACNQWPFFPALLVLMATLLSPAQAQVTLIDFGSASSIGNGSLFSDPSGVIAPAAVPVGGETIESTNGVGRALANNGTSPGIDLSSFSSIIDNPGVAIDGFTTFRVAYLGGNNAFGFLEDASSRLDVGTGVAGNGAAFTNSSDIALLSDAIDITTLGFAGTGLSFDLSVLAGTDSTGLFGVTGANSFDLSAFLVFDDSTIVPIGTETITGLPDSPSDRSAFSTDLLSDFSTVRALFTTDAQSGSGGGIRSLLDDVQLIVDESDLVFGDVNGDGDLDVVDFNLIRSNFFNTGPSDGSLLGEAIGAVDGVVDLTDFAIFREGFLAAGGDFAALVAAANAVPEPATGGMLLGCLWIAAGRARRRRPARD